MLKEMTYAEVAEKLWEKRNLSQIGLLRFGFDFYGNFDPETEEKEWAYHAAVVRFADASVVIINYYGGGAGFIYDIEEDSFLLPVLSIQPLVENAVKHGIAKKRGGGVVTLSSRQTEKAYQITVSDTGAGFDVEHYMDDGKVHVGLMNVRQRLASRMNATVEIDSTPGRGTTVTVTIPREKVNP